MIVKITRIFSYSDIYRCNNCGIKTARNIDMIVNICRSPILKENDIIQVDHRIAYPNFHFYCIFVKLIYRMDEINWKEFGF